VWEGMASVSGPRAGSWGQPGSAPASPLGRFAHGFAQNPRPPAHVPWLRRNGGKETLVAIHVRSPSSVSSPQAPGRAQVVGAVNVRLSRSEHTGTGEGCRLVVGRGVNATVSLLEFAANGAGRISAGGATVGSGGAGRPAAASQGLPMFTDSQRGEGSARCHLLARGPLVSGASARRHWRRLGIAPRGRVA